VSLKEFTPFTCNPISVSSMRAGGKGGGLYHIVCRSGA
jgi:hypothetical protein